MRTQAHSRPVRLTQAMTEKPAQWHGVIPHDSARVSASETERNPPETDFNTSHPADAVDHRPTLKGMFRRHWLVKPPGYLWRPRVPTDPSFAHWRSRGTGAPARRKPDS